MTTQDADLIRRAREHTPDMEQRLCDIAAIAHYGGLSGLSAIGAMVLIRKLTLPYFDTSMKEETARAAIARAEGGA